MRTCDLGTNCQFFNQDPCLPDLLPKRRAFGSFGTIHEWGSRIICSRNSLATPYLI